jgi:uncharacterized membrane protein
MDFNYVAEIKKANPTIRLIICLVLAAMVVISIQAAIEDYYTSLYGYELLPSQKVNPHLSRYIAAVPQLTQVFFLFVYFVRRNKFALAIAAVAFVFDFGTDYLYKIQTVQGAAWYAVTALETFFTSTVLSEQLLVMSVQYLAYTAGPVLVPVWQSARGRWQEAQAAARAVNLAGEIMYPGGGDDKLTEIGDTFSRVRE